MMALMLASNICIWNIFSPPRRKSSSPFNVCRSHKLQSMFAQTPVTNQNVSNDTIVLTDFVMIQTEVDFKILQQRETKQMFTFTQLLLAENTNRNEASKNRMTPASLREWKTSVCLVVWQRQRIWRSFFHTLLHRTYVDVLSRHTV